MNGLGKEFRNKEKFLYSWKYVDWPAFDDLLRKYLKKHSNVIDVGCGDGRVIYKLLDYGVDQKNIMGIDIDREMISIAQDRFPDAEFVAADAKRWKPVSHGRFDIAIAFHVLHYFNKDELIALLKGVNMSLKEGGALLIVVAHPIRWVKDDLSGYFKRGVKKIDTTWGTELELNMNTLEDYTESLHEAGFVIDHLLEPRPIEEGKEDMKNYEKYMDGPSRLHIAAIKR